MKSQKQKLNTCSSTEAELVGADDASGSILWTKYFVETQGYKVKKNILKIEKGNLNVEHCPTTEMIGDFFTKPSSRETFHKT